MLSSQAYTLLEVSEASSPEDIKKAYRRAASKYHPDKHQDSSDQEKKEAEAKFKDIKHAYEILTNKSQPSQSSSRYDDMHGFSRVKDAFEEMERQRRAAMSNGRDINVNIQIDMSLAISGGIHYMKLKSYTICSSCNGSGTVLKEDNNGYKSHTYCLDCNGYGKTPKDNEYKIKINPNSKPGTSMRLKGKGEPRKAPNGTDGDLYVTLFIKPDEYFKDLRGEVCVDVIIDPIKWLTGGSVKVATPTGPVEIAIQPMMQEGSTMRIAGRGIDNSNMFIIIKIDRNIPNSNRAQNNIADLLEECSEIEDSVANKFKKVTDKKIEEIEEYRK